MYTQEQEKNILIAEFKKTIDRSVDLGDGDFKGIYYLNNPDDEDIQYNTNISLLMDVVLEINYIHEGRFKFFITPIQCQVKYYSQVLIDSGTNYTTGELFLCIYNTVVEFIQWYNLNISTLDFTLI